MMTSLDSNTPAQAVRAMLDAGAVFMVRRRPDALGLSFTYTVAEGGDMDRCRQILAAVMEKPSTFFEAFKAHVQDAACVGENEGGVSAPPTSAALAPDRDRGAA